MDTDKVNAYLNEMIDFREGMINGLKYFSPNETMVKERKYRLGVEIELLNLLQEEMIAKGSYDICIKNPNDTISSCGRCSYDD